MRIGLKSEMERLTKDLNELQKKQIPFATSKAINSIINKQISAQKKEIKKVFDRPAPLTSRFSIHFIKSRKDRLEGRVYLNDWVMKGNAPEKYLKYQIEGGERALKGFEKLLARVGVLPKGYFAIPSKRAKRNAYGNMMPGRLNYALSFFGAQRMRETNVQHHKKRRTKFQFIVRKPRNGMSGGIWRLDDNGNAYPYLIFVKSVKYKPRYDFDAVSEQTFNKHWRREAAKALRFALKTAKAGKR